MTFVCLWSPAWRIAADSSAANSSAPADRSAPAPLLTLATTLLTRAPRVSVDPRGLIWADARGLPARVLANDLVALVHDDGVADVRAGVAATPVAAELAAAHGNDGVTTVAPGTDRSFVALFPVDALPVPPRVRPLLFGIGVSTCGALAELTREAVEVRLSAEAVTLWKLARADDARRDTLFVPMPRELPHATLDWMEYEVTDPARLLFVINALLERICDALAQTGEGARELTVTFSLANRTAHTETLRAVRATANRQTWVRLVRTMLERVKLPAAVTGIAARATRVSGREDKQGDLFDRGLSSAGATEDVLARLVEDQGEVVVAPSNSGHPLLEQRTDWRSEKRTPETRERVRDSEAGKTSLLPMPLTLQLAPVPQSIVVETMVRRDHLAPARYRDVRGWHDIVHVAGPDRVSGAKWDGARAYAREYFRCVTREGALVWLFRDARGRARNHWYLHGWWD